MKYSKTILQFASATCKLHRAALALGAVFWYHFSKWDAQHAHKPWVIRHDGVTYHFYCAVGSKGGVSHIAPPFARVPGLMTDLFAWLNESEAPMLVKSSVFHYEFEFIHPFPDSNGRTGRLWQTALLGSWRSEFYAAPVENIVWAHQSECYEAIRESGAAGNCSPFIDFMLDKILRTLRDKGRAYEIAVRSDQKSRQKSDQKIISILTELPTATIAEMMDATGLSSSGVKKILKNLKEANRLRRIGPDKGGHWEVV